MKLTVPRPSRRRMKAHVASFVSCLMLAGQLAPLALGSSPRPLRRVPAPASVSLSAAPRPAPLPFAAPNVTATKVDAFPAHPSGKAEPGDTVTYTVTIQNTGTMDATGVAFTDSVDPHTTLVAGSVNTQPITDPDTYSASGNIPISVNAAGGVLANDRDPDTGNNAGLTVTKVQGAAANVGAATNTNAAGRGGVKGSVTLAADGSLIYEPPPGFEGADAFTYEVSDGNGTDSDTVTVNVGGASGMVWFIQAGASGSNRGTFSDPFTSIGAFNTANAATGAAPDPKAGDFISLRAGTYAEPDGLNLRSQQKLIGHAVQFNTAFTAAPTSSPAYTTFAGSAGAAPTINTTAGNGVDLAADNTVRGLNVGNTPGFFKLSGGAVGSPVINAVSLTGAGGAVSVSTSGAFGSNVTFGTLESTSSPGANLNLVGVTGTLGVTSGGAGLSGSAAASPAVSVSGGQASFTYPGNVSKGSGAGALVSVSGGHNTGTITFQSGTLSATAGTGLQFDNADGTYNFNGTTTLGGGDAGVDITNGSGGTFNFSASTAITSPTGTAFNVASSPGSPNVTYSGTITDNTAGQRAVNIDGTTGGAVFINAVTTASVAGGVGNTGININNANGNVTFTTLTLGTSGTRHTAQPVTIANGTGTYSLGAVSIFTNGAQAVGATNADGAINSASGVVNVTNTGGVANLAAARVDGPAGLTTLGMTLTSVAANGTANGLNIQDTNGSFTVTGDGASDTANTTRGRVTAKQGGGTLALGSGGTIQNCTGAGVSLSNAAGVTLRNVVVQNNGAGGVTAGNVGGLTLDNTLVTGHPQSYGLLSDSVSGLNLIHSAVGGNATNSNTAGTQIRNVRLNNLTGANSVKSCLFQVSYLSVVVLNSTAGTATFTFDNSTVSGAQAGDGMQLMPGGSSNLTATVQNSTFTGNSAFGLDTGTGETGSSTSMNLTVNNNQFSNNFVGVTVAHGTSGTNTFSVTNNNFQNHPSVSININRLGSPTFGGFGLFSGTVSGNTIGTAGVPNSGSALGTNTIDVKTNGFGGEIQVAILNNKIREIGNDGIRVIARDTFGGQHTLQARIQNNDIANFHPQALTGIRAEMGAVGTDHFTLCFNISGNSVSGAPQNGIRMRSPGLGSPAPVITLTLQGWDGTTPVATFLKNQNPAATGATADVVFTNGNPGSTTSAGNCGGVANSAATFSNETSTFKRRGAPVAGTPAPAMNKPVPSEDSLTVPPAVGRPRAATTPGALSPVSSQAAPVAAKRMGGAAYRHTAADTSAPLLAPEPLSQRRRRKVSAPVLTDTPGGPNVPGAGGAVNRTIGTLRAGDGVTITFTVTVEDPYSGGPAVSNQGTVSGSNFSNVLTDDPGTGAPNDPTLTPVNSTDVRLNDAAASEPASGTSEMLFTLTLTQPAGVGGLSVNYTTADGSATGGASCGGTEDYVSAGGGTATVAAGSKVATIPVTVCADTDPEAGPETFTVTISNATAGTVVDNVAAGTITQGNATAGAFLISELRTSGPGGAADDFVEFYNNTNSPLTIPAGDGSGGYGLFKMGATCADTPVLLATIPAGAVIPARGHFLATGSQYTLANYGGTGAASGDLTLSADIENDRNLAVFSTADVANISSANRLDAVGGDSNTGAVCDLLREGANLPAVSGSNAEYSFFRKECDFVSGAGCAAGGEPKDTNDNSADFMFADTQATNISGVPRRLGAPGPENLGSPVRRDTSGIGTTLLDGSVSSQANPNRTRTFGMVTNGTFGTLTVRRRVTNNTGSPVTRLRFRVVELTTAPAAVPGQADLRALSAAGDEGVGPVYDANTCLAATGSAATPCAVAVKPTTLEEPPTQSTNGGGINSTLSAGHITLGAPLAPGASTNVRFVLGIQTTGTFRFYIIVEALP